MEQTPMYCDACQEAAAGTSCTKLSMCGIDADAAALRDLLLYTAAGLSAITTALRDQNAAVPGEANRQILNDLVMSTVNVNFDETRFADEITKTIALSVELLPKVNNASDLPEACSYAGEPSGYAEKAREVSRQNIEDADIRGLRGMITYACEGIASYLLAAADLGAEDEELHGYIQSAFAKTVDDSIRGGELIANVLETGRFGIQAMKLLKKTQTQVFGVPSAIEADRGVRSNPGILVAGDSLKDLETLLEQADGSGVDVYTYSDLLSAHSYPAISAHSSLAGNYGNAWWKQKEEFEKFNGPILVTGDEFTVPRNTYKDRLFTTGAAGYPGCRHIENENGKKDFSPLIELAKTCSAPEAVSEGTVLTGYGHDQIGALADPVSKMITKKDLRKVVVMLGADGRARSRAYYKDFVKALPEDTLVVSAGSIKYRFLDLPLGEIGDLPRFIDAGDAASADNICDFLLNLQEAQNLNDVGLLPVYFNVAWYDPKSIVTILELLYIGMKNIHLGPTSLTFLSRGIREVFVNYFGLKDIGDVDEDIKISFGDRGDKVTADMIVSDIVNQFPELVEPMLSVGLHCLGCGVSQMETLKEACEVHGLDVYDTLQDLNDVLAHPDM